MTDIEIIQRLRRICNEACAEAQRENRPKTAQLISLERYLAKVDPATPADAEAAGKREYLRVTGQLPEDGK